jgi:uncharacterized protein YlzI (FlbEa/FlbD family)
MIWLTDSVNGHKVAVNPHYVVAVFQIPKTTDGEQNALVGKTALNLTTGSIIVDESEYDVVGRMAAI